MDRKKKIEQIFGEHLVERYTKSKIRIQEYYWENRKEILDNFSETLSHGIICCESNRKQVKHIAISILYSSNITRSYELQIAFWDNKLYLDDIPVYEYWSPKFIFSQIEDDMLFFKKELMAVIPKLKDHELENIRNTYILNHYFLVMMLLKQLVPPTIEKIRGKSNILQKNTIVSYGRYMERSIMLYQG